MVLQNDLCPTLGSSAIAATGRTFCSATCTAIQAARYASKVAAVLLAVVAFGSLYSCGLNKIPQHRIYRVFFSIA